MDTRDKLSLAQTGGLILPRALADGHARCSSPGFAFNRTSVQDSDHGYEPSVAPPEQPRLWTSHSTRAPVRPAQRSRMDTRDKLSLAQTGGLILPRALADGLARCSSPGFAFNRTSVQDSDHGYEPSAAPPEQPRLWTSHSTRAPVSASTALADGHARQTFGGTDRRTHPAQSARGRTREMLKPRICFQPNFSPGF